VVEAHYVNDLPLALEGADLVVSGVSSFGVHWFASQTALHFSAGTPVISVTKGLFDQPDGTLLTVPQVTEAWLPAGLQGNIPLHAIGGPCIAQELAARRHTGVVFCGENANLLDWIAGLFRTDYYHVNTSSDSIGVETCAALKNAYAMGINLVVGEHEVQGPDGLANRYNPQAALFSQSLAEMRKIVERMGGDTSQVYGLPGAGDLYVTVFAGRTARLGRLLGRGLSFAEARRELAGETLEAVEIINSAARAVTVLAAAGKASWQDYPLLRHMHNLLQDIPSEIPWNEFF
jgi:glycerol-3-phosphate dehydrogenase (NAD(P)+)